MKKEHAINIELLGSLFPLKYMTKAELELLATQITLLRGKSGKNLVECGEKDNKALFVLNGKIKRISQDEVEEYFESGMPELKSPISFAIPHKYTVTCLSTVEFFRLENHIIANLLERKNSNNKKLTELDKEGVYNNPLLNEIYRDLSEDKLVIPALPKVAMAVRNAIEKEESVRKIELLIQADPALAAMLIKTANSALYRLSKPATSIEQAIMRMGLRIVKSLVTSYSIKHLFVSNVSAIKQRMKQLWINSTEVAAVSFVIAKHLREFDPEQALLMGLLHNVGVLAILKYAQGYPDIIADDKQLNEAIESLDAEVGVMILTKWEFSEEFVSIARESGNWSRNQPGQVDYTDLIIVARAHADIARGSWHKDNPPLYEMHAFRKLGLDQFDANTGLEIISDANEQLREIRSLLVL